MTRTPSAIRTRSNRGVAISERDLNRLRLLGRWHSLTAEHIVRSEQPSTLWSPTQHSAQSPEARAKFGRAVEAAKRRLRTLKAIEDDPGIGLGPLLGTALASNGATAYFASRIGARTAGLPWNLRNAINPNICQHAWMAADIGMALESAGYRVLSEREIATGIDRHADEITAQLESEDTANGRSTGKRPDVAILAPNEAEYIAIEVERDTDRSISVYEQKLSAYASNASIRAVWYICASKTTAKRVADGATRVFKSPGNFPLRIMTIPQINCLHFLDVSNLSERAKRDLEAMRPGPAVSALSERAETSLGTATPAVDEFADDGLSTNDVSPVSQR